MYIYVGEQAAIYRQCVTRLNFSTLFWFVYLVITCYFTIFYSRFTDI